MLGHEITVGKHIKFDPGKLDKTWIKNCLATGLSANFIEPLEATSIGTTIRQAFLLLGYLENYTEQDVEDYNNKINLIMDNVRDFVCLHYVSDREDTEFWKDLKEMELPTSLADKMNRWKTRLPFVEDFTETSHYLFGAENFLQVLYGLNLVDKEMLKIKYDNLTTPQKEMLRERIEIYWKEMEELTANHISHKQWLTEIREGR